jgi:hypothetical protein
MQIQGAFIGGYFLLLTLGFDICVYLWLKWGL